MTATERIRKHRAKLRAGQCSRLRSGSALGSFRGFGNSPNKGRETWAEVQDVLEHHLVANGVSFDTQGNSDNE